MTKTARPDALDRARDLLDAGEPTLQALAEAVGLSASHLQRRFVARFGLSPAEYLAQRKLGTLKSALKAGSDVSAALYDAGYGSPSRVYETGAAKLGMTPARYRAGGAGEDIRWSVVETALGPALVAATARGICMVELGVDDATLEARLRAEFPGARLQQDRKEVDHRCDCELALTDTHRLDDHDVEACRFENQHRLARAMRDTAQRATRR